MPESIYDLIRQLETHPDYLFGSIFTTDDLKSFDGMLLPSFNSNLGEDLMSHAGFKYLEKHISDK